MDASVPPMANALPPGDATPGSASSDSGISGTFGDPNDIPAETAQSESPSQNTAVESGPGLSLPATSDIVQKVQIGVNFFHVVFRDGYRCRLVCLDELQSKLLARAKMKVLYDFCLADQIKKELLSCQEIDQLRVHGVFKSEGRLKRYAVRVESVHRIINMVSRRVGIDIDDSDYTEWKQYSMSSLGQNKSAVIPTSLASSAEVNHGCKLLTLEAEHTASSEQTVSKENSADMTANIIPLCDVAAVTAMQSAESHQEIGGDKKSVCSSTSLSLGDGNVPLVSANENLEKGTDGTKLNGILSSAAHTDKQSKMCSSRDNERSHLNSDSLSVIQNQLEICSSLEVKEDNSTLPDQRSFGSLSPRVLNVTSCAESVPVPEKSIISCQKEQVSDLPSEMTVLQTNTGGELVCDSEMVETQLKTVTPSANTLNSCPEASLCPENESVAGSLSVANVFSETDITHDSEPFDQSARQESANTVSAVDRIDDSFGDRPIVWPLQVKAEPLSPPLSPSMTPCSEMVNESLTFGDLLTSDDVNTQFMSADCESNQQAVKSELSSNPSIGCSINARAFKWRGKKIHAFNRDMGELISVAEFHQNLSEIIASRNLSISYTEMVKILDRRFLLSDLELTFEEMFFLESSGCHSADIEQHRAMISLTGLDYAFALAAKKATSNKSRETDDKRQKKKRKRKVASSSDTDDPESSPSSESNSDRPSYPGPRKRLKRRRRNKKAKQCPSTLPRNLRNTTQSAGSGIPRDELRKISIVGHPVSSGNCQIPEPVYAQSSVMNYSCMPSTSSAAASRPHKQGQDACSCARTRAPEIQAADRWSYRQKQWQKLKLNLRYCHKNIKREAGFVLPKTPRFFIVKCWRGIFTIKVTKLRKRMFLKERSAYDEPVMEYDTPMEPIQNAGEGYDLATPQLMITDVHSLQQDAPNVPLYPPQQAYQHQMAVPYHGDLQPTSLSPQAQMMCNPAVASDGTPVMVLSQPMFFMCDDPNVPTSSQNIYESGEVQPTSGPVEPPKRKRGRPPKVKIKQEQA